MIQTIGISQAITSLNEVDLTFNLSRHTDPNFFQEWFNALPEITDLEKERLNNLKQRYFYYAADNSITEGTINFIIVSPLLEISNLCDHPFKIKAEQRVKIETKNGEIILQGFIDALVINNQFWIIVIEAKRYGFNVSFAIPQTLTYMMANPNLEQPIFGMITNGEDYIFVKLSQKDKKYDFSDKLTLSKRSNQEFYQVLRVMKQFKQLLQ